MPNSFQTATLSMYHRIKYNIKHRRQIRLQKKINETYGFFSMLVVKEISKEYSSSCSELSKQKSFACFTKYACFQSIIQRNYRNLKQHKTLPTS